MRSQCKLLSLSRSSYYYKGSLLRAGDQEYLEELDRLYLERPYYGSRRLSKELKRRGHGIGRSRVRRLMRVLGIKAIYPKRKLSIRDKAHKIYPYLLKNVNIDRPNKAWAADITYLSCQPFFSRVSSNIGPGYHRGYIWRPRQLLQGSVSLHCWSFYLEKIF